MSSKVVFMLLLSSLFSKANAQDELIRANLLVGVRQNLIATPAPIVLSDEEVNNILKSQRPVFDENMVKILKFKGISVDEKSEIYVHEEKNAVNLVCFKCLVRELPDTVDAINSYNERTIQ